MKKSIARACFCLTSVLLYLLSSCTQLKATSEPLTVDGSQTTLVQIRCLKNTELLVSESTDSTLRITSPKDFNLKEILQVEKKSDSIEIAPQSSLPQTQNHDSSLSCSKLDGLTSWPKILEIILPQGVELELIKTRTLQAKTNLTSVSILNPTDEFSYSFKDLKILEVKTDSAAGSLNFGRANSSNFNLRGNSKLKVEAKNIGNALISAVDKTKLAIDGQSQSLNIGINGEASLDYTGCVETHLTLVPRDFSKTIINAHVGGRWSGTATGKASIQWLGKSHNSCEEFLRTLER